MVAQALAVGDRIAVWLGNHRGTVRYVGPVLGHEGEWVGVEWDDGSRGKHDGCVQGQRLFHCKAPGHPATCVRAAKLAESMLQGQTLLEGLRERYCVDQEPETRRPNPGAPPRGAGVEVAGRQDLLDAVSDLSLLTVGSVAGLHIVGGDDPEELVRSLPALEELDLSRTLLSSWHGVAGMLRGLPALHTLDLSGTRLSGVPSLPALPSLPSLQTLVLSGTGVGWDGALRIAAAAPALRTLSLCEEGVVDLAPADGAPPLVTALASLESLDLSGNAVASWRQVAALGALPRLHTLALTRCPLGAVRQDVRTALDGAAFPALRTLLLGDTGVGDWASVQALDTLPALRNLRLSRTPMWVYDPAYARANTLARLAALTCLNGSDVAATERRDAELWYLRRVTDELAASADKEAVLANNPRYAVLIEELGPPAAPPTTIVHSGPGSNPLLEVVLVHGSVEVTKRLPGSLTVQRLRVLVEKLLGVPAAAQQIILNSNSKESEDISARGGSELRTFSPPKGARIEIMNMGAAEAAARRQEYDEMEEASLQSRMESQEAQLQYMHSQQQSMMGWSGGGMQWSG